MPTSGSQVKTVSRDVVTRLLTEYDREEITFGVVIDDTDPDAPSEVNLFSDLSFGVPDDLDELLTLFEPIVIDIYEQLQHDDTRERAYHTGKTIAGYTQLIRDEYDLSEFKVSDLVQLIDVREVSSQTVSRYARFYWAFPEQKYPDGVSVSATAKLVKQVDDASVVRDRITRLHDAGYTLSQKAVTLYTCTQDATVEEVVAEAISRDYPETQLPDLVNQCRFLYDVSPVSPDKIASHTAQSADVTVEATEPGGVETETTETQPATTPQQEQTTAEAPGGGSHGPSNADTGGDRWHDHAPPADISIQGPYDERVRATREIVTPDDVAAISDDSQETAFADAITRCKQTTDGLTTEWNIGDLIELFYNNTSITVTKLCDICDVYSNTARKYRAVSELFRYGVIPKQIAVSFVDDLSTYDDQYTQTELEQICWKVNKINAQASSPTERIGIKYVAAWDDAESASVGDLVRAAHENDIEPTVYTIRLLRYFSGRIYETASQLETALEELPDDLPVSLTNTAGADEIALADDDLTVVTPDSDSETVQKETNSSDYQQRESDDGAASITESGNATIEFNGETDGQRNGTTASQTQISETASKQTDETKPQFSFPPQTERPYHALVEAAETQPTDGDTLKFSDAALTHAASHVFGPVVVPDEIRETHTDTADNVAVLGAHSTYWGSVTTDGDDTSLTKIQLQVGAEALTLPPVGTTESDQSDLLRDALPSLPQQTLTPYDFTTLTDSLLVCTYPGQFIYPKQLALAFDQYLQTPDQYVSLVHDGLPKSTPAVVMQTLSQRAVLDDVIEPVTLAGYPDYVISVYRSRPKK